MILNIVVIEKSFLEKGYFVKFYSKKEEKDVCVSGGKREKEEREREKKRNIKKIVYIFFYKN